MKKYALRYRIILSCLVGLFLISEVVWFLHIYRIEAEWFRHRVNITIKDAAKATSIISRKHNTKVRKSMAFDLRTEGRCHISYKRDSISVKLDTTRKSYYTLLWQYYYDFRDYTWTPDTVYQQFLKLDEHPPFAVTFVRLDSNRRVIDRYPADTRIGATPAFPALQLGYIDRHYLTAYYCYPLKYFLFSQRYGLAFSLIPLLLILYYFFVLLRRGLRDNETDRFIERQTIFIHDLKTPLCTNRDIGKQIAGNLDTWPVEKISEKLEIIHRQYAHLLSNMKELMLRSVTRWGGEIENHPFDLRKALEEVIGFQQAGHEEARITLDFRLSDPVVNADPFHLTHIVGNLVGNAVKHSGGRVNIRIICEMSGKEELLISVCDDGPGIAPREQRHIFRQGYGSVAAGGEEHGHGLGLAYVRRIVRQYGGRIRLESRKKVGTEFHITLPLKGKAKKTAISCRRGIYSKLFIGIVVAEAIWLYNLYASERESFCKQQTEITVEAINQLARDAFCFNDTVMFRNNWDEKTVTAIRGKSEATIPLKGLDSDSKIYIRIGYDLRGEKWLLDSLTAIYRRLSKNPLPVVFTRIDSTERSIDRSLAEGTLPFLPLVAEIPLGYVDGHQLRAEYAFPWQEPLMAHLGWLIFAVAALLLAGWMAHVISGLSQRQYEVCRFQREKLQHFIRHLEPPLIALLYADTKIIGKLTHEDPKVIRFPLSSEMDTLEKILIEVNHILDQLVTIRKHRPVFD